MTGTDETPTQCAHPGRAAARTLVLANSVHRCVSRPNARAWHTAQTGQDARARRQVPVIVAGERESSPLADVLTQLGG
ncbi:hypothetical protein IU485_28735, partial [Nocardia cyriacigeorgica]|nr:hypothetical protein [Nocardia cyriacigeorgica]